MNDLAARIDALLPQTQCTRCGYPDCRSYAQAVADGAAGIDQCPPGGRETVDALAALLERASGPVDPARGTMPETAEVAYVVEEQCIGCFKCIAACPVDAIVGAPKRMHTVIAAECSGCELCLPVCPTDCIEMRPRDAALPPTASLAPFWRRRYDGRNTRRAREQAQREGARRARGGSGLLERAQAFDIEAAIARARGPRTP